MKRRKFAKMVIWSVVVLMFTAIVFYNLLRIPSIQTMVVRKLASNLTEQLGTTVHIQAVNVKFFSTASIEGIFLEDVSGDTLFYSQNIQASIRLFRLFQKRLELEEVSINGLKVYLDRQSDDEAFNYQHLLDHFSSGTERTSSPWTFQLDRIKINDGKIAVNDQYSNRVIDGDLGSFRIYLNHLDSPNRRIDISQIGLGDSRLTILQHENRPLEEQQDSATQVEFPFLGWDVKVGQIRLEETDLRYRDTNYPEQTAFNPADMHLLNFSMFLDDLHWSEKHLKGYLSNVSFSDKSGLILDELMAKIEAYETNILVSDFKLITPNSEINNETTLSVSDFGQLANFSDSVVISSQFRNSEIDIKDLKLLAPGFDDIQYINTELQRKIKVSGHFYGPLNNLKFENFNFKVGNLLALKMGGDLKNLASPLPFLVNVSINQLSTSRVSFCRPL